MQGIFVCFVDFRNSKNISFRPAANGTADMRQSVAPATSRQYKMFQRRQYGVYPVHFRFDFLYVFFGNRAGHRAGFRRQITAQSKQIILNPQQELTVLCIVDFFQQASDESV